jgi:cyclophilin family peptidyl-prolyl cis-trans isomerase
MQNGWIAACIAIAALSSVAFRAPAAGAASYQEGTIPALEDTASAPVEKAAVRQGLCLKLETGGTVIIELYPEKAPKTVERVTGLARQGFYDGLEFHRVESFLVQTGKKDHDLPPLEGEMFSQKLWHEEGMVGMARLPNGYDTATTQFYIMKERRPMLNGEYTLFGRVVGGMEFVHSIKKGHRMESLTPCELR